MPDMVVDANTGNVLVVHRRSLGIASALFLTALMFFILGNSEYFVNESSLFNSLGSLFSTLLLFVLFWRCFSCCCLTRRTQATGYVVVQAPVMNQSVVNTQAYPTQAYPTQTYPTQAYPTQTQPVPLMTCVQPAFNPHLVSSGPILPDAPPCYMDAVTIPAKQ